MGKTKTAVIGTIQDDSKKSSKQLYQEKKARQQAEMEKANKVQSNDQKRQEGVKTVTDKTSEDSVSIDTKQTAKHESKRKKADRGKKYINAKSNLDKNKEYPISEAISEIKKIVYSNFDETLEMHLIMKKASITAKATLPHPFGKGKKIEVADVNTIEKLQKGKIDFDILLASPEFMPKLVPFARILGPKGLMPNPKNGTVIKKKSDAKKFDANTLNLKTEKDQPLIHTSFGKVSMDDKKLTENAKKILEALGGSKQIVRVFMKSTMSPSLKLKL